MANPDPKISPALQRIFDDCFVPEDFQQWCLKKKIVEPIDLALLSPDEKEIPSKIFDQAKADTEHMDTIEVQGPIRKAWWHARKAIDKDLDALPKKLDESKELTLSDRWAYVHGVTLAPEYRVGPQLLVKLATMVSLVPRAFTIFPLDKITIESYLSSSSSSLGTQGNHLTINPEETLVTRDLMILGLKMRAFLFCLAYVCIQNPTLMSLQVAQNAYESMNSKISSGDSSPECLRFFKKAYLETMRHWQRAVVSYKSTYAEAIKSIDWVSLWDYKAPESGSGKGAGGSGGGKGFSKKAVRSLLFQAVGKSGGKGGKSKGGNGKGKGNNNWNNHAQTPPKDNGGKGKGKGKGKLQWPKTKFNKAQQKKW